MLSAKDRLKLRIAQEAARIMAEEGVHEHLPAKQKAAERLGAASTRNLPRNEEIDRALEEYHRLYRAGKQPDHIGHLRKLALEAMRFLREFSPHLIGGVLDGGAGEFSPITLQLFPDTPEDVMHKLMEHNIPFQEKSVTVSAGMTRPGIFPALYFLADGTEIELHLLPSELMQQRTVRKDKTLPKGNLRDVERLVRDAATEIRDSC